MSPKRQFSTIAVRMCRPSKVAGHKPIRGLVGGEAKVILNEVNATKPSQLKGYIEVAGGKADVIIANPSGIHCEGCG